MDIVSIMKYFGPFLCHSNASSLPEMMLWFCTESRVTFYASIPVKYNTSEEFAAEFIILRAANMFISIPIAKDICPYFKSDV